MSQGVPAAGSFLQSFSAMFQGVAQNNAYRSAAAADDQNAKSAELQGALDIADIKRRGRAVQGEAISALAEGGGSIAGGSAQDLIYQNSLEIEFAALNAKFTAAGEARGYRFRAKQERQAGKNALIGGILGAGAAAVTGVSNARGASSEDAAYQDRYNAYFPGGQRLPMPPPPPSYSRSGG
jgi:hypothetical protein